MSPLMPYSAIASTVRRLAISIGVLLSLAVPLVFGVETYIDLSARTCQAARLSAERIAQYAFVQGETWRFSSHRVSELIAPIATSLEMPRQLVDDANGMPVVEIGVPTRFPYLTESWPIVVRGETIGSVRVVSSLDPLLTKLVVLVLLGAVLGTFAYIVVHDLPLRALRRANEELDKAQAALAESHATLSEALRVMPDAFALYDASDRLVLFNWRYLDVHGLRKDEVAAGMSFEDIMRRSVARKWFTDAIGREDDWIAECVERHRSFDGIVELALSDGRQLRVVERTTADGGRMGLLTDITSLKQSEEERAALREQLHHAQKFEAIGKLTGGMAHDFNNYLGIIIGNLDLLDDHIDAAGRDILNAALTGAENSAQLTRSLLAYSRQQPLSPRRLDVRENLESAVNLLRRALGEDIALSLEIAADLWRVRIDGSQLDSAILNLANNARDAMPNGGALKISARNVRIDRLQADAVRDAMPGDYVVIEITDAGIGMTPEIAEQAFEPFFSTKPVGHGTGLGLSMVYGFVKQSGGWVEIRSEVGRGTSIGLYLPRDVAGEEPAAAGDPAAQADVGGWETILVVEDNPMMRQTAVDQLRFLGYRSIEAENGVAALAILEKNDRGIDLLFTDAVMPGSIDGFELVRRARKMRPGLKVLMTSGYPGDPQHDRLRGDVALLAKPYRRADLANAVSSALHAAPKHADTAAI